MPASGLGYNGQSHSEQPQDGLYQLPNEHLNSDDFSNHPHDLNNGLTERLHEP